MTSEERRAYRDGQVDERLRGHDDHLARINGSIDRSSAILETVARTVDKLGDQVTGLTLTMPKLTTVTEEVVRQEEVAAVLHERRLAARTRWEQYRNIVAWAVGIAIALVVFFNFIAIHFH